MAGLTERQREILEFLSSYISANGFPPSRAEIGDAFNFNANAAQCHLDAIEKKGFIAVMPRISRGIMVLHPLSKAAP